MMLNVRVDTSKFHGLENYFDLELLFLFLLN